MDTDHFESIHGTKSHKGPLSLCILKVLPFLSILSAMMELTETGAPADFEDPMSNLNARTALPPLFLAIPLALGAVVCDIPRVLAHSWYPPRCCGGEDCRKVGEHRDP